MSLFPEVTFFVAGTISPLNFKLLSWENFTGFITRQQKETCYCRSWLTLNCSFCRSNELEQVIIENDSFGTLQAMTNMNRPQKTTFLLISLEYCLSYQFSMAKSRTRLYRASLYFHSKMFFPVFRTTSNSPFLEPSLTYPLLEKT